MDGPQKQFLNISFSISFWLAEIQKKYEPSEWSMHTPQARLLISFWLEIQ
jgi:hypothetical protein